MAPDYEKTLLDIMGISLVEDRLLRRLFVYRISSVKSREVPQSILINREKLLAITVVPLAIEVITCIVSTNMEGVVVSRTCMGEKSGVVDEARLVFILYFAVPDVDESFAQDSGALFNLNDRRLGLIAVHVAPYQSDGP
ncbi:hypothetical protein AC579_2333 [Pseudocercospora musae]|uniref:Uncharacterized protein n=1 Tax=Pseudocercospora musae TaxID=113226 RepID=A0A139H3U5_9PEZI|nr:hypothetical protein AC579_2333 [Pseudocercospora musae]